VKAENPTANRIEFQLDFAGLIRDPNELGFLPMIPSWKAFECRTNDEKRLLVDFL
jgi:hypothetical protein